MPFCRVILQSMAFPRSLRLILAVLSIPLCSHADEQLRGLQKGQLQDTTEQLTRNFRSAGGKGNGSEVLSYRSTYISDLVKNSARSGISGALAGMVQVITLMWLRTAVNYQYRYGVTISQSIRDLHAQGGIYRFYRGISFALLQGPLAKFGGSCANEISLQLCRNFCSDKYSLALSTIIGGLMSGIWRFLIMPIDICKTVLQVDGKTSFDALLRTVRSEKTIAPLYKGAVATMLSTVLSSYPWLYTYNWMKSTIGVPDTVFLRALRNGFIGFVASAVSDIVSNSVRVVKIVRQTSHRVHSYPDIISQIIRNGGWTDLLFRGLLLRVLTNGLQSMIFTVIWRGLMEESV